MSGPSEYQEWSEQINATLTDLLREVRAQRRRLDQQGARLTRIEARLIVSERRSADLDAALGVHLNDEERHGR
jgi:hypothetical protein